MLRRHFLVAGSCAFASLVGAGCRGRQVGHVLDDDQRDMVGSHTAGAETFNRLIDESVVRLLERQSTPPFDLAGHSTSTSEGLGGSMKRVCFVGVENRSAEEIGDFKDLLYQQVDTSINRSGTFQTISRRYVESGLGAAHLRPSDLFTPDGQQAFMAAMSQAGHPFDYMLFATLTSGTTQSNNDQQRDYLLTLELVNIQTGSFDKESAKVRKGYHKSHVGMWKNYNPFTKR